MPDPEPSIEKTRASSRNPDNLPALVQQGEVMRPACIPKEAVIGEKLVTTGAAYLGAGSA